MDQGQYNDFQQQNISDAYRRQQQSYYNNLQQQYAQQQAYRSHSKSLADEAARGFFYTTLIQNVKAGQAVTIKQLPQLPPDPKTRIAEIDKELDIIRGRVPTPKGYKINPRKAKALMTERAELEGKL